MVMGIDDGQIRLENRLGRRLGKPFDVRRMNPAESRGSRRVAPILEHSAECRRERGTRRRSLRYEFTSLLSATYHSVLGLSPDLVRLQVPEPHAFHSAGLPPLPEQVVVGECAVAVATSRKEVLVGLRVALPVVVAGGALGEE